MRIHQTTYIYLRKFKLIICIFAGGFLFSLPCFLWAQPSAGIPRPFESLTESSGPWLNLPDLENSNPKRGRAAFGFKTHPQFCISQNARDISDLPPLLLQVRQELHELSFLNGDFAESFCWIFTFVNNSTKYRCFRSSSPIKSDGKQINEELQPFVKDTNGHAPIEITFIHSHPADFEILKKHFNVEPGKYFLGINVTDMWSHHHMEDVLAAGFKIETGFFLSLVFPLDKNNKTDFYYSARTFALNHPYCREFYPVTLQ